MDPTTIPPPLQSYLTRLDAFISDTIVPLQHFANNNHFFDHTREFSRTNWPHSGLPHPDWESLLAQCVRLADAAGFYRFSLPGAYGGDDGSNLAMAVIREHLAAKGLGLFNDLQTEHSVVGNFPDVGMFLAFGTETQKEQFVKGRLDGRYAFAFGLTEPGHGNDATRMETRAARTMQGEDRGWRIDGKKMWQTGMHRATHSILFARTSGNDGDAKGITAFVVPTSAPGVRIESYEWTFNMPTDHATVSFSKVWVPDSAVLGPVDGGLAVAQAFVHENRIRQAASSLGAAVYCIEESVKYARQRQVYGKELAVNQGIQYPLVELATQVEMLRLLIRKTAAEMDTLEKKEVERKLSDKVAMCNYWANRLCCEAADRAIQVHGGIGYSRHKPFEHIYRHHRRYRITEGSEEIQMRKIAAHLFGYMGPKKDQLSKL